MSNKALDIDTIKIKKCKKFGYANPAQWLCVTDDDRELYIRYRDGWFSITELNLEDMLEPPDIFCEKIGCDLHGHMSTDEMIIAAKNILDFTDCTYVSLNEHPFVDQSKR